MEIPAFLDRWLTSAAAERANKDSFLNELCDVLGVPRPDPTTGDPAKDHYVFEYPVSIAHAGGKHTVGKVDLYRAGAFLLEAKQGGGEGAKKGFAKRGTPTWNVEMGKAFGQALGYARALDTPPPFLVVADLGHCFDLYADFDGSRVYRPFPTAQQSRLFLVDLAKHADVLRAIWTDPYALDPSRRAARITREVAAHLAELAKRLEASGHKPETVAQFLMRCIFTMFAEDIGLLPPKTFVDALAHLWIPAPLRFPGELEALWRAMNDGQTVPFLGKLLRFNGGLFRDQKAIALKADELKLLHGAAACDWRDVEPAIFGTLLERALDPRERHRLGAHYTPRAYVERLVRPTIEEPLRAEWEAVRTEVQRLVGGETDASAEAPAKAPKTGKKPPAKKGSRVKEAVERVRDFHRRLCAVKVLDPACGSGNFLYVAMELMKRIESEVLALLAELGTQGEALFLEGVTVTPGQFLGIEKKPWAKEIAELVLWIGFLQWHARTRRNADGKVAWMEPVLQDLHNIECRDAVLVWDREEVVKGDDGKPLTRWDGESYKVDPLTGEDVPDDSKRIPMTRLVNPRRSEWPTADFIVGNPPFVANRNLRRDCGDGYTDALKVAYPQIKEAVDLVMFFWWHAAEELRAGSVRRFGLISTNSIRMIQNQGVVRRALESGMKIVFAIPDHPWPPEPSSAKVRVSMVTMVGPTQSVAGCRIYLAPGHDEVARRRGDIELSEADFRIIACDSIPADLSHRVNVSTMVDLRAMEGLAHAGMKPYATSLVLTEGEAQKLLPTEEDRRRFAPRYRNGKDVGQAPRGAHAIDLFGIETEAELRELVPGALYQHLLTRTKPERAGERNPRLRKEWWLFEANRPELRRALTGLPRYIVTVENSPVRAFVFIDGDILPDQKLRVIASADGYLLGVLSSRVHVVVSERLGGRQGIANTPVYNTRCVTRFPFPNANHHQSTKIRTLGEKIDAHRKACQDKYPTLALTGMYNVLAKLRAGEALTDKDKVIHEQGLVSVLRELHDELDRAVFDAYGWPATLTDEEILERVVALNAERAAEEARGVVRWLRPEYQHPTAAPAQTTLATAEEPEGDGEATPVAAPSATPWPKKLAEQLVAVNARLATTDCARTAAELAAGFRGAGEATLREVLDGLEGVGRVVAFEDQGVRRWKAVASG